jgi:HlyD family secretion protein
LNSSASAPPPIDTSAHLRSPTKRRWRAGIALGAVVAVAAVIWATTGSKNTDAGRYVTATIDRGNVVAAVTATGVLHPLTQVDVGSEVSGVIRVVNVDFNDRVTKGQVLARLDTAQLQARVLQTQASLESATAGRRQAEATTHESQLNFHRCERLAQTKMCSQQDLDQAEATWLRAQAAEAAAIAQVSQNKASLDADQTALRKADIVSPIDGIVLNRFVEPGQTVAATFQTPLLFTLAEDLSQMQLKVDVDEADIGRVHEGQVATFTVDAYPRRRFDARVSAVRFAPKTVEGVVTYEAVLEFDNSALLLRPGMTATADIVTNTLSNVLRVPNAALRVKPPGAVDDAPPSEDPSTRTLWVLPDDSTKPKAVRAHIGESDGHYTEVADGAVDVGTRVITDVTPSESDAGNGGMFPRGPHGGH